MKLLLISDTHGDLQEARQILRDIPDLDLILHCGDYQRDAAALADGTTVPIVSVRGNCDGQRTPDRQIISTPAGNLLLTHGHMEQVKRSLDPLLELAAAQHCIAVCYGHTHVPHCEMRQGIWLINPGSLGAPRDGSGPFYAILTCTPDGLQPQLLPYRGPASDRPRDGGSGKGNNGGSGKGKPKVQGGFLRRLLNYSDRF